MVVKINNRQAVAEMLIYVSTLVNNGTVDDITTKAASAGRSVADIASVADIRKAYSDEEAFRNDAMAVLAVANAFLMDGANWTLTLQNMGRGRGRGWHVVAISKKAASKAAASSDSEEMDDAKAVQEAVAQAAQAVQAASEKKASGRRKAAKAAQASQESQAVATQAVQAVPAQAVAQAATQAVPANTASIVKRPDKERSCLVYIDKTHKDTLKAVAEETGIWCRWNWRHRAWNVGRRGLAAFVDGLKSRGLKVRVDQQVAAWIQEDRQQAAQAVTPTVPLIEV